MSKGKILISGSSISGPALAYWLCRQGYEVTIVEKKSAPQRGGYNVDIRGVAVGVVERMGIAERIRSLATDVEGGTLVNRAGKHLVHMDPDMVGLRNPGDLEIGRGDLSTILNDVVNGDVEYLYSNAVTGLVEHDSGVRVEFLAGSTREFDLVVGADGLRSGIREVVFGPEAQFVEHLGEDIAVFSVPNHLGLDRWGLTSANAGSSVNLYSPRASSDLMVMFSFATPEPPPANRDRAAQQAAVRRAFSEHGWEVPRLLAAMPDATDFYYDSLSQVHMPAWSRGRTVLLGDAGYSPSPASGQGTSLGLVGAYVLAGELADAAGDHHAAFCGYEARMREFVKLNQDLGRRAVKEMNPSTRMGAWAQVQMFRILPRLPDKTRAKFLDRILKMISEAANGIELKTYMDAPTS